MKAVVLVGGEGTRLRPLTETIPKPLIPFMNRPFLHQVLDHLAAHGVAEAILSSPYLEEGFRGFLESRHGDPAVTWITEREPLGTSGAVAGALDHLDETFLVLNGDILTDLDLTALIEFHHRQEAIGTIALTRVTDARRFGLVEMEEDGRVLAFKEKQAQLMPGTVNAGTYVLEPRALAEVPRGVMVSIERETFPGLIARDERLFAYVSDGYWRDLGLPEDYLQAHFDALEGKLGIDYPQPLVGEGSRVAPDAVVGTMAVLGGGSVVASEARIDRSVLHEGASVGEGAVVEESVLGAGAELGAGAIVRNSLLAAGAGVAAGTQVDGARIRPGEVAS
ncbi:MAG TPA: NDP-sugar synthase [Actinomycetota bacterium]|nr:NDP-sugar synthase [Actinomycetota bacterium]